MESTEFIYFLVSRIIINQVQRCQVTAHEFMVSDRQNERARWWTISDPLKMNGKMALARQMFADQSHSIPEICAVLRSSRAALYPYVKEAEPPT